MQRITLTKWSSWIRSQTTILTAILIVSVSVNVLLARKVKRLQSNLDTIELGKKLLPGSQVPPLQVTSLTGESSTLSYGDTKSPTVIYVFSMSCGWCERNEENIKFLVSNTKDRYRFIGLSLDRDVSGLNQFVTKTGLPFPVYHTPSTDTWKNYKLSGTPTTIVVSPDGKVLDDWAGAYAQPTREQVESFFKIKLPGIKPVSINDSSQTIH